MIQPLRAEHLFYTLDENGYPIPSDLKKYSEWMAANREFPVVGKDQFMGIQISTVFLGINHNFGFGPPVLWETMVFGGWHDQYQRRYSTLESAKKGHKKAVKMVRKDWWKPSILRRIWRSR